MKKKTRRKGRNDLLSFVRYIVFSFVTNIMWRSTYTHVQKPSATATRRLTATNRVTIYRWRWRIWRRRTLRVRVYMENMEKINKLRFFRRRPNWILTELIFLLSKTFSCCCWWWWWWWRWRWWNLSCFIYFKHFSLSLSLVLSLTLCFLFMF